LCAIDLGEQPTLEILHLHKIDLTFENGLLDALPRALAYLRNASKAAAAGPGFRVYVVTDNDKHWITS
jgi:hypothetical protein